jgi:hypothetical protein
MFTAKTLQKMALHGLTCGEHYLNLRDLITCCAELMKLLSLQIDILFMRNPSQRGLRANTLTLYDRIA